MIGIYKITSPTFRTYIGQSIDISKRFKTYRSVNGALDQPKLYNSLRKHGIKAHTFEIIEECTIDQLNNRERYWQEFYDVCNSLKGLNCVYQNSDEKRKMYPPEFRLKMSKALKGIKVSEQGKANMRAAFVNRIPTFGYKHTDEAKRKLSELSKGNKRNLGIKHSAATRYMWEENKAAVQGKMTLNLETGIYYVSLAHAAKTINVHYSHLARMLKGERINRTSFIYV